MTSLRRRVTILCAVGLVLAATTGASTSAAADPQPWLRPGLSTDARVDLLLAAMTLPEKIAELHADTCPPYESCIPANTRLGLPEMVLEDDSTGVAAGMSGVTALPATIAASASWDPRLLNDYGQVIGNEEKAKGIDVALAPTVNILRVPEWGRSFESLGEDPYLNATMGAADVTGIQSAGILADVKHFAVYNQEANRKTVSAQIDSRTLHEIYLPAFAAAVKAGAGSFMASYNAINGVSVSADPYMLTTVLRDELGFQGFVRSDGGGTYSTVPSAEAGLDVQVRGSVDYFGAPLLAAVQAGQVSMATINSMVRPILREMFQFDLVGKTWGNGSLTQNVITPADTRTALTTAEQGAVLLRDQAGALPLSATALNSIAVIGPDASPGKAEGGGSGHVVTPFLVSPVQGIQAADPGATVHYSAGLPTPDSLPAIPAADLSPAYQPGTNYTGTLTAPVTGQYLLAVNDPTGYSDVTLSVDGTPVLSTAGTPGNSYGTGSVQLQAGVPYQVRISGPTTQLSWETPDGLSANIAAAVTAARQSQVAVVVVGDQESEAADRVNLNLDAGSDQLVEAVAAANPHTIVVLNSGAPVLMPWLNQVSGVLEAWYPGEQDGTALADLLFGKVNPSGKLPMTFPATADQTPATTAAQYPGVNGVADYSEGLQVGYRWYQANNQTPLFPFGYGLSYTSFAFSHLTVSRTTDSLSPVTVSAMVTNTGSRAGSEVAQLYLGDPASTGEPSRQLKGFQKVTLQPGQSTRVHFTLSPQDFATWDSTANTWVTADGNYQVAVGDSSANLPLTGTVAMAATTGDRVVSLAAPTTITPGGSVTVSATLAAGGDLRLRGARLALQLPPGWQATVIGTDHAGTLDPNQTLTVHWRLTAPADAPTDIRQIAAIATFHSARDGAPGTLTARTQLTVNPQ
ncbi:MAG TPA: glycoside hydrolase family 3 C-terminal domain-containing protein [Pseudonocardiaceae bacterium]|nr:glycoside hydrolase family 3 C-terminal domain-containing protein [Pseudonocardiaceae bacterium]